MVDDDGLSYGFVPVFLLMNIYFPFVRGQFTLPVCKSLSRVTNNIDAEVGFVRCERPQEKIV